MIPQPGRSYASQPMPRMSSAELAIYQAKHASPVERIIKAQEQEADDEKALHNQILNWLRVKGVHCVIHSRMDRASTTTVGQADFCWVVNGVPCACEAKVAGRQPRPEQIGWLEGAKLDGWITGVVRSLDDVIAIYREAKRKASL